MWMESLQLTHHHQNPMKTQPSQHLKFLALGLATLCLATWSHADVITWGGTDGEYTVGANWSGGVVPNTTTANTSLITTGNVTFTTLGYGNPLFENGGTLQLDGGSFTVNAAGDPFAKVYISNGGKLDIRGGAFYQGNAENVFSDSTSSWNMTSGSANMTAGQGGVAQGTFTISGGVFNARPVSAVINGATQSTISGGEFNIRSIGLAADKTLNFSGGDINIYETADWNNYGIGTTGLDSYINFTLGSTGTLFASGLSFANAENNYFLSNDKIRYNGTAVGASWATYFDMTYVDGQGVYISAIPEPSTLAFMALAGVGLLTFSARRRRAAARV